MEYIEPEFSIYNNKYIENIEDLLSFDPKHHTKKNCMRYIEQYPIRLYDIPQKFHNEHMLKVYYTDHCKPNDLYLRQNKTKLEWEVFITGVPMQYLLYNIYNNYFITKSFNDFLELPIPCINLSAWNCIVRNNLCDIKYLPSKYKTQEIFNEFIKNDICNIHNIPDEFVTKRNIIDYFDYKLQNEICHMHNKIYQMQYEINSTTPNINFT